MAKLKPIVLVFAVAFNFARAHVAVLGSSSGPNHLHPVHGLYVKPSSDGTTGDLYVAATEDSGVKTQWLTDQPISFLPHQLAYTQSLTNGVPDETIINNQKRAVIASPPIKYTYALPASTDGNVANAIPQAYPYSYTAPATAAAATPVAATEGVTTECTDAAAATPATPYYPYSYQHQLMSMYYSQMMSAFANALNAATKESSSEEGATATTSTSTATPQASVWPYSYPWQYVMVDPSAWAKAQASTAAQTTSTPASTASSAASNESSQ